MQIDSGNQELKKHIEKGSKNAQYLSPTIQNELINLCGAVIKDMIIKDVKTADGYSILADETADISGKEQLSIGVRFFDEKKAISREEFLGFVDLDAMDADTISINIDHFIQHCEFDSIKCVGQGYDGCATMAGKHNGVYKKLLEKYPKALFFHCASHKLNLVVNDLNTVADVRNTISTIKDIIIFFRESVLRRKYAPNIPMFCETRWSQKHKSIAVFEKNFESIVKALDILSKEGNTATRKAAFQLHSAATKSSFIICVILIAKYSALLEPIVNALQAKSLDLFSCSSHIDRIVKTVKEHRNDADKLNEDLLNEAKTRAEEIDIELTLPRITERQLYRSNYPTSNAYDYWRNSIFIPYLDSLISSLNDRFSNTNTPAYSLLLLHPANMLKISIQDLISKIKNAADFYGLSTLESEIKLWYDIWQDKKLDNEQQNNLELCELVKEASLFFPSIKRALHIAIAQPCTTCTIERSFSTLRRVKTWLRSTMTENRLNGKRI